MEATLILAWGNPGRLDDGLGPALADEVSRLALPDTVVASDYQLQVEDAADVARRERVIFVDADRTGPAPFRFERIQAADSGFGFSTHSVTPAALLALARDLFGGEPEAWLMGIRGYEFDGFGERLSTPARQNLLAALAHLEAILASGRPSRVRPTAGGSKPGPKPKVSHV